MTYSTAEIWTVILGLTVGTFIIRFSFLGPLANLDMPPWVLRLLRYTPVAVLPGLIAPLVIWPAATGGETDPARIAAALTALILGVVTKNVVAAIFGGGIVLYAMLYFVG